MSLENAPSTCNMQRTVLRAGADAALVASALHAGRLG